MILKCGRFSSPAAAIPRRERRHRANRFEKKKNMRKVLFRKGASGHIEGSHHTWFLDGNSISDGAGDDAVVM